MGVTMTEAEWLACEDPKAMLEFLKGNATHRKLIWLTVACWPFPQMDEKDYQFVSDVADRRASVSQLGVCPSNAQNRRKSLFYGVNVTEE